MQDYTLFKKREFVEQNSHLPNNILAEISGLSKARVSVIVSAYRKSLSNKPDMDLEKDIFDITAEIATIQNKMNLYMKTAEERQRKLKATLDEKKENLRFLKSLKEAS